MSGRARPARPRRADLSQHFLRRERAGRLVAATSITASDLVIEVGAGRGALTRPLAHRAGRLVAVEVDAHLAGKLAARLGRQAQVVSADFRALALPDEPYKVLGNVPFSITTDIVRKLAEASTPPLDAWLIVQRELAHRLCGPPYTRESLLSLRLKPHWHVEILDRLKRTDFDPPPAVECVVLWMCHRGRALLSSEDLPLYLQVVGSAFRSGGPVKQALRPWLSRVQLRRLAADLRFDVTETPSALLFEQWLGIVRFLAGGSRPGGRSYVESRT